MILLCYDIYQTKYHIYDFHYIFKPKNIISQYFSVYSDLPNSNQQNNTCCGCCHCCYKLCQLSSLAMFSKKLWKKISLFKKKYFDFDMGGFIFLLMIREMFEIVIQFIGFTIYAGYNYSNNNVNLQIDRVYIQLFAAVLSYKFIHKTHTQNTKHKTQNVTKKKQRNMGWVETLQGFHFMSLFCLFACFVCVCICVCTCVCVCVCF